MYVYLISQREDICFSKSIHILILFHFCDTFKNSQVFKIFLQKCIISTVCCVLFKKKKIAPSEIISPHCECESWNKVASKDPPLSTHCCFYKESDNSKATKTYILCPIVSKESDRITFCVNFARRGLILEDIFNLVSSSNN